VRGHPIGPPDGRGGGARAPADGRHQCPVERCQFAVRQPQSGVGAATGGEPTAARADREPDSSPGGGGDAAAPTDARQRRAPVPAARDQGEPKCLGSGAGGVQTTLRRGARPAALGPGSAEAAA